MTFSHLDLPIDETSRAWLAEQHLTLRVVDTGNEADHCSWHDAVSRGFLGPSEPADQTETRRPLVRDDRLVGVYDDTSAMPAAPVATTHCWPAELTVPGGRAVTAWAVSGVTVAQTHRRRGIARALIKAELRTASALGMPVAILTVSESTIYGRFGFSPAALARDLTISTHRVRWTGPETTGRIHYVTPDQVREDGHAIFERVRATRSGEVSTGTGHLWQRQIGLGIGDENAKNLRIVRHDDADGIPQGFAVFQLIENEADASGHTLKLHTLVAATPGAYAALWRFMLEMDLVSTVTAHLRPVDEPLRWMIGDFRAVHVDEFDHLWVRVLDVPAALSARTYGAEGTTTVIAVDDPLGFATGTFSLEVDGRGGATVTTSDEAPDATVSVNTLGSLLLGGVSARTLLAAGQLSGDVDRLDRLFGSSVAPFLSTWF